MPATSASASASASTWTSTRTSTRTSNLAVFRFWVVLIVLSACLNLRYVYQQQLVGRLKLQQDLEFAGPPPTHTHSQHDDDDDRSHVLQIYPITDDDDSMDDKDFADMEDNDNNDNSGEDEDEQKQGKDENEQEHETDEQVHETNNNNNSSSNNNNNNNSQNTSLYIRSWGCDLTETPLIFVHNGKSGGGNIRARLAAAAQGVDRGNWKITREDDHYYPIPNTNTNDANTNATTSIRRGKYCNSVYPHYVDLPHIAAPLTRRNFEGKRPCNATTPLGMAVACPHAYRTRPGDGGRNVGGMRRGGSLPYANANCLACDDDYYLEADYYNFTAAVSSSSLSSTSTTFSTVGNPTNSTATNHPPQRRLQGGRRRRQKKKSNTEIPPPFFSQVALDPSQDPLPGWTCDVVFTAHNNMGSELNWLPPRYLKEHWWDRTEYATHDASRNLVDPYWNKLLDDRHRRRAKLRHMAHPTQDTLSAMEAQEVDESHRWCPQGYELNGTLRYDRPSDAAEYMAAYEPCGLPLAARADEAFVRAFGDESHTGIKNYSPFYASMPLHRVTVMRDPWSWVISKFFWHKVDTKVTWENGSLPCYDVHAVIPSKGDKDNHDLPVDPHSGRPLGWMEQFCLLFLIKLCGNDCRIRYENGMMTLQDMEAQVSANLRTAFSVVGILHETESFYDMVTDRISYVTMDANPHITGGDHATAKTPDNLACKDLFATNTTFRQEVLETVPAFAALERMYQLGIQVNAFQKEELRQCKLAKGEEPTRGTYEQ